MKYVDGSVFTGHMKNNRKHGTNCEFKYPDGDTFIGEFDMDQFK